MKKKKIPCHWMKLCGIAVGLLISVQVAVAEDTNELRQKAQTAAHDDNYQLAVEYAYRLLEQCREGKLEDEMAQGLKEGGNYCYGLHRYIEALDFYAEALQLSDRIGDGQTHSECLANIGTIYALFKDYERAVFYLEEALDEAIEAHDDRLVGIATTNLVAAHCRTGNTQRAHECLRMEMEHPIVNIGSQQFRINYNQGLIALTEQNYRGCIYYQEEALSAIRIHDLSRFYSIMSYNEIGKAYEQMQLSDSAIIYYTKSMVLARELDADEQLVDAYRTMVDIYKSLGVADSVTAFQARYTALNDSIFNQRQFNNQQNVLSIYERKRNEAFIDQLNARIAWLISGVVFFVVVTLLVVYYNRRLSSAQKLLVKRNEELIQQNNIFGKMLMQQHSVNQQNGMTDDKADDLLRAIAEVMEDHEMIFSPDFNMNVLAKRVNSNTSYVSMVINETYHKNFKSFLNEYRIREACRRLTDTEHYSHLTISGIGESVGYSSTNGFFIAFKKITGMTPAVYQKYALNDK